MSIFKKLMPTRSDAKAEARLVSDIDKIVSDPVGFKLHGRVRTLKPITTEEFLNFTKAYNRMSLLNTVDQASPRDFITALFKVFKTVCDDISMNDIEEMSQVQIGAVYALILKSVSGEIFTESQEDFEKKTMGQMTQLGLVD